MLCKFRKLRAPPLESEQIEICKHCPGKMWHCSPRWVTYCYVHIKCMLHAALGHRGSPRVVTDVEAHRSVEIMATFDMGASLSAVRLEILVANCEGRCRRCCGSGGGQS